MIKKRAPGREIDTGNKETFRITLAGWGGGQLYTSLIARKLFPKEQKNQKHSWIESTVDFMFSGIAL